MLQRLPKVKKLVTTLGKRGSICLLWQLWQNMFACRNGLGKTKLLTHCTPHCKGCPRSNGWSQLLASEAASCWNGNMISKMLLKLFLMMLFKTCCKKSTAVAVAAAAAAAAAAAIVAAALEAAMAAVMEAVLSLGAQQRMGVRQK